MAAVLGVVISFLVYWYLKLVTDNTDLGLHCHPGPGLSRRAAVVAAATAGGGWSDCRGDDQVPARAGRPLAG
jgi:hypothetical protein